MMHCTAPKVLRVMEQVVWTSSFSAICANEMGRDLLLLGCIDAACSRLLQCEHALETTQDRHSAKFG